MKRVHADIADIDSYFLGGAVKKWSLDPYSLGAFALFTAWQETNLKDELQASFDGIRWGEEHTTNHHAWIEGAEQSGIKEAFIINNENEVFDIAIIGGGCCNREACGSTRTVSDWKQQRELFWSFSPNAPTHSEPFLANLAREIVYFILAPS